MESPQPFPTPNLTTAEPISFPEASPTANWPPSPPPSPAANKLFFGPYGFRAGWGMAIFAFLWFIFTVTGSIAGIAASGHLKEVVSAQIQNSAQISAWKQAHPNQKMTAADRPHTKLTIPFTPAMVTTSDSITFFGMLAAAWIFSRAERRRLAYYGIGQNRLRDFLPGAVWGLAALSLLVFVLRSLHLLYFDARLLSGSAIILYGIKWLIAFLFVGFAEEYFLRGYLQYTLARGLMGLAKTISPERTRLVAFWLAAFVMSILFGMMHLGNEGENALGILQVFVVGMVFSYALWRTGSLWWAIGFHMAWDWAQSFLYGVPDSGNLSVGRLFQTHIAGKTLLSGGVDGPEGSILAVPVLLLMVLIIRFTTTPGPQPPLEQLPKAVPASTEPLTA